MGNRILKESIRMSQEIDALTWFEEVLFYRLIVTADDYGVCPADPVVLAHMLFPRKENISRKMTEEALNRLEALGLIQRYTAEDERYLCLASWSRHQRLRSTIRKYPGPEQAQEEAEAAPEAEPEAEPEAKPEEEAEPPVITLPLNDGTEFGLTQPDVDEYRALYPAVDVLQELRAMRGWCLSNKSRRKTGAGIRRFINSWLTRAQDSGGHIRGAPSAAAAKENPYLAMVCEGEVQ